MLLVILCAADPYAARADEPRRPGEGDCLFLECSAFFNPASLRLCKEERERIERDKLFHQTFYYDVGGHFTTPYLVAIAAGIDGVDARELSYWAQYPDLDARYDAIRGLASWDFGYGIQRYVHSLRGGPARIVRDELLSYLARPDLPLWKAGLAVHALGDSFAHSYVPSSGSRPADADERLYRWPFGHAFSGHGPDRIATDKAKFFRYVDALYASLKTRAHKRERCCLVTTMVALVSCDEWNADTDEVEALNCFGRQQHVLGLGRPKLEQRLTRAQVREWIDEIGRKAQLSRAPSAP